MLNMQIIRLAHSINSVRLWSLWYIDWVNASALGKIFEEDVIWRDICIELIFNGFRKE